MRVVVHVQSPREHTLAHERDIRLGIVVSIDGIVVLLLVDDLGAALGNGLKTCPQVHDADVVLLVERDRLNLEGMGPSCQAVDLAISIERVVHLHCIDVQRLETNQNREEGTDP